MPYGRALPVAFAGLMVGCALHRPGRLASPRRNDRVSGQIATASWYGPRFDGHRTASGEFFHQRGLSAASPSLPLGTRIRVTNLANGHAVKLRITDRGPFVRGRIVDVTSAAAEALGMVNDGVIKVTLDIVR